MLRFLITNHNEAGDYKQIQGVKVLTQSNQFVVIAPDREEAIRIADELLGHRNYSLPFDYQAEPHVTKGV